MPSIRVRHTLWIPSRTSPTNPRGRPPRKLSPKNKGKAHNVAVRARHAETFVNFAKAQPSHTLQRRMYYPTLLGNDIVPCGRLCNTCNCIRSGNGQGSRGGLACRNGPPLSIHPGSTREKPLKTPHPPIGDEATATKCLRRSQAPHRL